MAVSLSDDEYLYFVDSAVRGMARIVADLGDEHACTKPDIPGANTPYALLTHCLGVIQYWAGQVNLGRDAHRDRAAEFTATGPVADLLRRTDDVLEQLAVDVAAASGRTEVATPPDEWALGHERTLTPSGVLLHVYEEVSQHLGQLEVIRDALRVGPPPFNPPMPWLRAKQGVKWARPGPDLIPAWVADMDFPVAPPIRAALSAMIDRGDLGYPEWSANPLAEAFADRMKRSFGWAADPALVKPLADLIQGVQVLLHLATEPEDGVVVHLPNYPPFPAAIGVMRRRLVPVQLVPDGQSWSWDHTALVGAALQSRVLLLVNPQNPTGRAFTRVELEELAEVAEQHDLLVISDEIHAELAHRPHEHIPFASLAPDRTVTITSATKAYNIAGVRTAVVHVGPEWVRKRWDDLPPFLLGHPNALGVEATVAAWRDCDDWLAGLREHLHTQRDHLAARVTDLPGLSMRVPDGGYLAWLDCTAADLGDPAGFFRANAKLELAPGPDYDPQATDWVRLNFATGRAVLDEILDRMAASLATRPCG
jgi:cystathionine beta-lyase